MHSVNKAFTLIDFLVVIGDHSHSGFDAVTRAGARQRVKLAAQMREQPETNETT